MADVQVKCTRCENTVRVSEYVDFAAFKCRACGAIMEKPDGAGTAVNQAPVRLAGPKPDPAPEPASVSDGEALERNRRIRAFFPKRLSQKSGIRRKKTKARTSSLVYWLLFAVVMMAAVSVRWGGMLSDPRVKEQVILGALVFFGFLHVSIIMQAFHEDVFQGILCLLIPFYSLYYLLTQLDSLYMRAIGGGMLVAFAYDLGGFVVETAARAYHFINHWIMTVN